MSDNSLPGCIGYFGMPLTPNRCETCRYTRLCKRVVAKERLKPLVAKILEVEATLRGEEVDNPLCSR